MRTIKTYSKRAPFYNAFIVTYVVELPTSRLLARNDFRVAGDLGVVERMLPSQFAPQFSRSGYHDLDAQRIQALAVKKPCQRSASLLLCDRKL
jgi:predicted kinase